MTNTRRLINWSNRVRIWLTIEMMLFLRVLDVFIVHLLSDEHVSLQSTRLIENKLLSSSTYALVHNIAGYGTFLMPPYLDLTSYTGTISSRRCRRMRTKFHLASHSSYRYEKTGSLQKSPLTTRHPHG